MEARQFANTRHLESDPNKRVLTTHITRFYDTAANEELAALRTEFAVRTTELSSIRTEFSALRTALSVFSFATAFLLLSTRPSVIAISVLLYIIAVLFVVVGVHLREDTRSLLIKGIGEDVYSLIAVNEMSPDFRWMCKRWFSLLVLILFLALFIVTIVLTAVNALE